VNRGLIAVVTIVMTVFVAFLIWAVVRGQRRQVATGAEGLIGAVAIVQTALAPKGTVLVEGERWTAKVDSGSVKPGEEVVVTKVEKLKLVVTKEKTKERS